MKWLINCRLSFVKVGMLPGFSQLNHSGGTLDYSEEGPIHDFAGGHLEIHVFCTPQVVEGIHAAVEHLHLWWLKLFRKWSSHYFWGEGMIRPLDQFVDNGWGFSFEGFPHGRHLPSHIFHYLLPEVWGVDPFSKLAHLLKS